MAKYRKKPVIVEAERFTDENKNRVFTWIRTSVEPIFVDSLPAMRIPTLEGDMIARIGDWIIKGVKGEYYPCRHDIFVMTYELVEEDSSDGEN